MRILIVLTYYRPHTSGLTIYAERLAKALVKRGHTVTVLTSHYQTDLPKEEVQDGVRIVRVPVMLRISKGVFMPTFGLVAFRMMQEHDVVQLHLPQFDAAWVAMWGRLMGKPTVITYHCDLRMPPGLLPWLANQAVRVMNNLAALFTHRIVTYTRDYAENSSYLRRYLKKLQVIPPPVELPAVGPNDVNAFWKKAQVDGRHPVIGMAARFATEKGVEVLLNAMPEILAAYPNAMVLFAGPYQNIVGEEKYLARLMPAIRIFEQGGHWHFVGNLNQAEIASFYPNLDILVLPSLNSTEAFGLVQIEAMMNGRPCVASDLPGVRQPVRLHNLGRVIPIGDSHALAEAVKQLTAAPYSITASQVGDIKRQYLPDTIAEAYEELFGSLLKSH